MKIISHRGFCPDSTINENTRSAFWHAINCGVDGIETDIRLSADSQPILFHDRLSPDDRPVASLSRQELEEMVNHEVPTLDEVLKMWPDVYWDLEVKCTAATEATLSIVRHHPHPEKILITSFRHDVVAQCAPKLDVACGLLLAHYPDDLIQMLQPWHQFSCVRTLVWDFNVIDSEVIAKSKSQGFRVYVYGAQTLSEHKWCKDFGVDAVITDHPNLALEI